MKRATILAAALFALAPIAGCIGADDDRRDDNDNFAPTAELTVSDERVYTGKPVTFDGKNSTDQDGHIVSWSIDFGDGTTHEARSRSQAHVEHTYAEGGVYHATLTVLDDGGGQAGALSDTDEVELTVDHKQPVAPGALVAPIAGQEPPTPQGASKSRQMFPVNEEADSIEVNVTFDSFGPVGASRLTVELVGPDGEVLDNSTVTVGSSENKTVELSAVPADEGEHVLRLTAEEGSATFRGEIRVLYADAPDAGDEG